jgi:hypothetical protein
MHKGTSRLHFGSYDVLAMWKHDSRQTKRPRKAYTWRGKAKRTWRNVHVMASWLFPVGPKPNLQRPRRDLIFFPHSSTFYSHQLRPCSVACCGANPPRDSGEPISLIPILFPSNPHTHQSRSMTGALQDEEAICGHEGSLTRRDPRPTAPLAVVEVVPERAWEGDDSQNWGVRGHLRVWKEQARLAVEVKISDQDRESGIGRAPTFFGCSLCARLIFPLFFWKKKWTLAALVFYSIGSKDSWPCDGCG